jgi:hypothetical protein
MKPCTSIICLSRTTSAPGNRTKRDGTLKLETKIATMGLSLKDVGSIRG